MTATEPTIVQLRSIIGLLIVENDALRENTRTVNLCYGRRTYDPEQIDEARKLSTSVEFSPGGCIVAKVES